MRRTIIALALLVAACFALPLFGARAKHGWTKVELKTTGGGAAVTDEFIAGHGAEIVVRYDGNAIVTIPRGRADELIADAKAAGIMALPRDGYDVLKAPGAAIDARIGIVDAPQGKLIRDYPAGNPGLFLVQFIAPVRPDWIAQVGALGWELIRYVPDNGFIAIGTANTAQKVRDLDAVQWVDFYHPYLKYSSLVRDGEPRALLFEVPAGPQGEDGVDAIRAAAGTEVRVYRGRFATFVHATLAHGAAEKLLHQRLVIGVGPEALAELSDERQAMSLTSNLNSGQTAPTNPTNYWSWVTSRCSACSLMSASTWKVGIADTGLDDGATTGGHPDLSGRKYFGEVFFDVSQCTDTEKRCGWFTHGTMVAGVIGGAGASGTAYTDGNGYYYGQGVAPLAGIFSTRHHGTTVTNPASIEELVMDATTNGVTIQNHSFNATSEYGVYTALAQTYDVMVRDTNDTATGEQPLFITVSAGNFDPVATNPDKRVAAGGTAKNVLSVSGTENARPVNDLDLDPVEAPTHCSMTEGDSYMNIMRMSRGGTAVSGYVKPDVVAPASAIVSTHPSTIRNQTGQQYCIDTPGGHAEYAQMNGTSFAAPVGAGAGILIKRYLGSAPGDVTPALTKAMIIAGARSIRGGSDRATGTTVGDAPNGQQGFGRISLDDILTGSTPPVVFDQDDNAAFTVAGQKLTGRFKVRDGSKAVKVVLVWSDAPATIGSSSTVLVNNLDLLVTPLYGSGSFYRGNSLYVPTSNPSSGEQSNSWSVSNPGTADDDNNVEYVRFYGATNAEFAVTVDVASLGGSIYGTSAFEQDFALVAVNADLLSTFESDIDAPVNTVATANGTTVTISWATVSNATGYDVERKVSAGSGWTSAATVTSGTTTSATDAPNTADGVVLYRVRARNGSMASDWSNVDVAYAKAFTDEPVQYGPVNYTYIKASHVVELRNAANTFRSLAGLSAAYTGTALDASSLIDQPIDDSHFATLLSNINAARQAMGLPAASFSTAPVFDGYIQPSHVETLRNALK